MCHIICEHWLTQSINCRMNVWWSFSSWPGSAPPRFVSFWKLEGVVSVDWLLACVCDCFFILPVISISILSHATPTHASVLSVCRHCLGYSSQLAWTLSDIRFRFVWNLGDCPHAVVRQLSVAHLWHTHCHTSHYCQKMILLISQDLELHFGCDSSW